MGISVCIKIAVRIRLLNFLAAFHSFENQKGYHFKEYQIKQTSYSRKLLARGKDIFGKFIALTYEASKENVSMIHF